MIKTLIAVPTMDTVPAQFAHSLATMERVGECSVAFQIGSLIYSARNELAMQALKHGIDQVLWLDSDMVFPQDTLRRLMDGREKGDIVSGLYYRRVAPFSPVLFDKMETDEDGKAVTSEFSEIPAELFEIGACGFGCVLTPTDIFIDVLNEYGTLFEPYKGLGEDLSFCLRARSLGFKIVCDPSIKCGHVGHYVVTEDFYKTYNRRGLL